MLGRWRGGRGRRCVLCFDCDVVLVLVFLRGRKRGMRFMEVECKSFADMGFCRVLGLRR